MAGADKGRARLTACIVACALFMQNLDSTVIATALPRMARAFGADPAHMSAALTAYLISLAVFIPASGWIADRFGARPVFRAAIAVFALASMLCGQAGTLPLLIAARVLQGLGGAMMVPVGRLVMLRSVAKSQLVSAMAWLTVPALVGPVVGPPIGGLIVTYASWRWIFYINLPIGALGILLVTLFVPDLPADRPGRFDARGLALCGAALACTMAGLETIGRGIVPEAVSAAMLGIGLLAGVMYQYHAGRCPRPLLDLGLLRLASFRIAVLAGTFFRIGIGAVPFLLPLMLQDGFGDSPAQSGMITFASSAGALLMKPATRWSLHRIGFRDTLVWNTLASALLLGVSAAFRPTWPAFCIYAVLLLGGFLRSLQFTAYNTLAFADVAPPGMSAATSLYSTAQQLSMSLGITTGAAALAASMALAGRAHPALADFSAAFLTVAAISLLAAPLSLRLSPDAGAELVGRARLGALPIGLLRSPIPLGSDAPDPHH